MRVSQILDAMRARLPLKGRDLFKSNAITARQRARFAKIGQRAARRDSFRVYWREHGAAYLEVWPHWTRRQRRRRALEFWREQWRGQGAS